MNKQNLNNFYNMKIKSLLLSAMAIATAFVSCQKDGDLTNQPASVSLDVKELTFETPGTKTVSLTVNRNWEAEIPTSATWLGVNPAKGEGSADAQTIEITVSGENTGHDKTATVTFRIVGAKAELKVIQKGAQGEEKDGEGTLEAPYKASQALEIAKGLAADTPTDEVYIKGIVHKFGNKVDEDISQYGSMKFYISDDGSTTNSLEVYGCKYFNGAKFTSADQLKLNDAVVIKGKLINYKGTTPEVTQGCYLITINGSEGEPAETGSDEGLVMATSTKGFIFKTNAATKYAFDAEATKKVKVGDIITLEGTLGEYAGLPQYTNCTVEVKSSGNAVTYPTPTVLTKDNIGTYNDAFGYVKMSGKLTKSGNYYNVVIPGASMTGSLSYPVSVDASLDGKNVDIEGYYVGISGTSYFNVLMTNIALSSDQPEEETPGEGSLTLKFPDDNSSNNGLTSAQYESEWTAKAGDFEFKMFAFNNNNWGNNWTYVRCGRKSVASVATITTSAPYTNAIDKVVLNATKWDASKLNSAKLYAYSDAAMTNQVSVSDFALVNGTYQAAVSSPAANLYYKIELDCQVHGSSNGFIEIKEVILWVNAK